MVQLMQELLKKNQHVYWNQKHQEVFDSVTQALAEATTLAAPNEEGSFVLDTDASAVAIAESYTESKSITEKPTCGPSFMAESHSHARN